MASDGVLSREKATVAIGELHYGKVVQMKIHRRQAPSQYPSRPVGQVSTRSLEQPRPAKASGPVPGLGSLFLGLVLVCSTFAF